MAGSVEAHLLILERGFSREERERILDIFPDRTVSIVSPVVIYDTSHIISAYIHAGRLIARGRSRTRDPALEVIRSLTGSKQLGESLRIASPVKGDEKALVTVAPDEWPREYDPMDPPGVKFSNPPDTPDGIGSLDYGSIKMELGGERALRILGITPGESDNENRMKVLEKVALTDI